MKLDLIDLLEIFTEITESIKDSELSLNAFAMLRDYKEANSDVFLKTRLHEEYNRENKPINWVRDSAKSNLPAIVCFNDTSNYNASHKSDVLVVPIYVLFRVYDEPFEVIETKAKNVLKRFLNELYQYGWNEQLQEWGKVTECEVAHIRNRINNRSRLSVRKERANDFDSIGCVLEIKGTICEI